MKKEIIIMDLSDIKDFDKVEKKQAQLYKKYDNVQVETVGFTKVMLKAHN